MAQITTGLVGNPTAHYSFSYDSSLQRTAANPRARSRHAPMP